MAMCPFYKNDKSGPSLIIVYPCHSLTASQTQWCFVDLTDVTLACEDANSKQVDVVTVADVGAENSVNNCSVGILKLT